MLVSPQLRIALNGRRDRYISVRAPGGILVECTANVAEGFYLDEAPEDLGTRLNLPFWYEDQREAIVASLEPLRVPESNWPRPGAVPVRTESA